LAKIFTNFVAKATKVNHGKLAKIIYLLYPQNPLLDACKYVKILNKNKIQNGGGRHLGFLHKQQLLSHRLMQMNEILQ